MSITLKQLRYFDALARALHFGRAADEAGVTQPALSMQIQDLERSLGAILVERRQGAIALTPAGREIADRARHVLASVRDLMDHARRPDGVLSGRLALGVIPSIAPYLLPAALPMLQARHPRLDLQLRETQTRHLIDSLQAGHLDVALLSLPVEGDEWETLRLFDDRFVFVEPAGDEEARTGTVDPAGIDEAGLLLLEEGHCLRDQALALCGSASAQRRARYGATSLTTVMQMVAGGYGATLLPEIAMPVEVRAGLPVTVKRFAEPQPFRTVGLVWRKTAPRRADMEALGAILLEAAAASPN